MATQAANTYWSSTYGQLCEKRTTGCTCAAYSEGRYTATEAATVQDNGTYREIGEACNDTAHDETSMKTRDANSRKQRGFLLRWTGAMLPWPRPMLPWPSAPCSSGANRVSRIRVLLLPWPQPGPRREKFRETEGRKYLLKETREKTARLMGSTLRVFYGAGEQLERWGWRREVIVTRLFPANGYMSRRGWGVDGAAPRRCLTATPDARRRADGRGFGGGGGKPWE